MKKLLCILLALMMMIPAAVAENTAADEIDVTVMEGKPIEDQAALRDGSDETGYTPKKNQTVTLTVQAEEGKAIAQVYLRLNKLPQGAELLVNPDGKRWVSAVKVENPGPEFVLTPDVPAEQFRVALTFRQATAVDVKELRGFGRGELPEALHAWQHAAADILLLLDSLPQADVQTIAEWTAQGRSVAVGCLASGEDGLLETMDALWAAGVRTAPLFGGYAQKEGDGAALLKQWNEKSVIKTVTGWVRRVQPLLVANAGEATALVADQAAANARAYRYEVSDAAVNGLWLVDHAVAAADVTVSQLSALPERTDAALRAWCRQDFASAQHGDPATIPYPAQRLADGYLPEGEFVHEDPENGLWAYLSPTVQVEIIRYEQPEVPRVWFETDVRFKPESEQFKQQLYVNASFKDQQIYPETLAQSAQMVLAINADYYPYRLERKQSAGNILRAGVAMYDYDAKKATKYPNLDTVVFTDAGTLEVFHAAEMSATALAARGDVHDTLSFGPYLARDGALRIYDGLSWDATEPRTAIGMNEPGHFTILTVEGRMPKKGHQGMNINELSMLMYSKGVSDACSLDGGSTSVLIFMGSKLNVTGKGNSIGQPRNQHELFGVGTSDLVHTDKINKR